MERLLLLLLIACCGLVGGQTSERACVTNGPERACRDISALCSAQNCPADQVCALTLSGSAACLPASVKDFENCGPEELRLSQPCPADAGIRGFGAGCTYCRGGNPFTGRVPPVPVVSPPAIPRTGSAEAPRPPAPPPSTKKACVVRHIGDGEFKKGCVDISEQCRQKRCPAGTVCGLNLDEEVECFPESVKKFENCAPDFFRLSQPCPADSGIRGFGMGCNFCVGGNPFAARVQPPAIPRRLTGGGSPPGVLLPSPPPSPLACMVRHSNSGEVTKECIDISSRCEQRKCPSGTVCGLDLNEKIECFPQSVKEFENCGSEMLRLSQPCPQDAGIRGFGMGCTFCVGGNPFLTGPEPPSIPTRVLNDSKIGDGDAPAPPPTPITDKACVVVHVGSGEFKEQCVDITDQCARQNCPADTVCGLDLNEEIQCFPPTVKEFENCGPEFARLSQPCPADAGIRGFGMGCTFCVGGNPFASLSLRRRQLATETTEKTSVGDSACVVRFTGGGNFERECKNISAQCEQQNCPPNTVCGLDLDEQIQCFPQSVKKFENCGPDTFRLSQPCPADAGIRGFGMGCTFCKGGNPFGGPPPLPELPVREPVGPPTRQHACVVTASVSACRDISAECRARNCPNDTVCALDLTGSTLQCLPQTARDFQNCGSESLRLSQPCPADAAVRAFGMGCTFCESDSGAEFGGGPPPLTPTPTPVQAAGSDQSITSRLACVSRITSSGAVRRGCIDLTELCRRRACPADRTCALDTSEQPSCFAASQLPLRNCGTTRERVARPCPDGAEVVAFGAGCTFCRRPPPPPGTDTRQRACLVSGASRRCQAIDERCAKLGCAEVCALAPDGAARCFAAAELLVANCGPERRRLDQPCAAGLRAVAFGAGCTYCAPL